MGIISEKIEGNVITNEIKSSNLKRTQYNIENQQLIVEFNNGTKYEYDGVPHRLYVQFRKSESQGKFFTSNISRAYPYKKLS